LKIRRAFVLSGPRLFVGRDLADRSLTSGELMLAIGFLLFILSM
jgi:hypothetical protein